MKMLSTKQKNKLYKVQYISLSQYKLLKDFMYSIHCKYHYNNKVDSMCWAEKLDDAKISWSIQNLAAYCMDKYNSRNYYASTLLAQKNIFIRGA